jgi:hypothetical protein
MGNIDCIALAGHANATRDWHSFRLSAVAQQFVEPAGILDQAAHLQSVQCPVIGKAHNIKCWVNIRRGPVPFCYWTFVDLYIAVLGCGSGPASIHAESCQRAGHRPAEREARRYCRKLKDAIRGRRPPRDLGSPPLRAYCTRHRTGMRSVGNRTVRLQVAAVP